jgi:cobalt/nickel transport system ATP-binding protein
MTLAVEIQDFHYRYHDGTNALSGITFSIQAGQRVALIGPNGAGKSTILLAIAGFIKGTGKILVDGVEVRDKNLKSTRRVLGCCLENPEDQLFMPTLFDDVAFGPLNMGLSPEQVKTRVTDALTIVGLAEMADKAPHHLSAGQKRAAAIATIVAMSPKIITLDEPDGSLDPANRNKLVKLLKSLPQTLIIATCNMSFAAAIADRVILINKGTVAADGDTRSIMSDSRLMTHHGLEVPHNL